MDELAQLRSDRAKTVVNARIDLAQLLNWFGHDARAPEGARSVKQYCPWGHMHSDMGAEKAFRIYDSNTGWCFAGCGYFNPVMAAAKEWDCTNDEAAHRLAVEHGVAVGDLDTAIAQMESETIPDKSALVAALGVWVASVHSDSELARRAMARCAGVVETVTDEASAELWLEMSKTLIDDYVENEHG